ADVERRRRGLEDVVGGIARAVTGVDGAGERCPALLSWDELVADPELGASFQHLIALDPPLNADGEAFLAAIPTASRAAQSPLEDGRFPEGATKEGGLDGAVLPNGRYAT